MSPEEIYETFPSLDSKAQAKFYAYLEGLSRPDVWAWEFLRVNRAYIQEWVTHADALKHLDGAPSPIFGAATQQAHQGRRDELLARATIGASKWGLHHTYQDPRVRGDDIDRSVLFWKPSLYEEHSPYLLREDSTPDDLPPSEWSRIFVILAHEGVWNWARDISRKRSSASCVRRKSY